MQEKELRQQKVQKLKNLCLKAHFQELAPNVYELKGPYSKTLTICTLIHGNEIGGIEVFFNLLQEIESKKLNIKSNLRLILGNVEAFYEDKRFLETDMNRSFDLAEVKTNEEKRAKELESFLNSSDVLIDIHQTIGATETPFFIFEYEDRSYNLARYLNQSMPIVTHNKKRNFKGKTSTAYMVSKGLMGVTIETGQKGIIDSQIGLGLEISRKAIETDFTKPIEEFPVSNTFTFHQIIQNPNGNLELTRKMINFDKVLKNEVLAKNDHSEVTSDVNGSILFPKYGDYAKKSVELALILRPVESREEITG
ncbi:succinylglutamate desuccinylase/aspartoacylase domain-containing protein [Peredibacter starrii]|uniref:Succinylglutamate desuccinylase/aspartoacylase family protein n=1 Tax=Peredibacter starrii TaxID=28202 RepID=A0AAX4HK56_9BACT|nr:succinylglutamate desuccinylase/aspartoacylase family protein [Peredibacter starrii]WPU63586.1 succinylglutamate desuccinylase/aspartoacylase family protein [Peredibacter starrii]